MLINPESKETKPEILLEEAETKRYTVNDEWRKKWAERMKNKEIRREAEEETETGGKERRPRPREREEGHVHVSEAERIAGLEGLGGLGDGWDWG
jgi:hypothetical protein